MKNVIHVNSRSKATSLTRAMGARVRSMREGAGLTQIELAEMLGYEHSSSITFIEQGRNNIKPDVMVLLCTALNTSPNELFGWSGVQ